MPFIVFAIRVYCCILFAANHPKILPLKVRSNQKRQGMQFKKTKRAARAKSTQARASTPLAAFDRVRISPLQYSDLPASAFDRVRISPLQYSDLPAFDCSLPRKSAFCDGLGRRSSNTPSGIAMSPQGAQKTPFRAGPFYFDLVSRHLFLRIAERFALRGQKCADRLPRHIFSCPPLDRFAPLFYGREKKKARNRRRENSPVGRILPLPQGAGGIKAGAALSAP